MRARIHRGTKQIGGTCVEIESGGESIIVDFGLPLDGDASDITLVPAVKIESLLGIIISHPHIDHYGLLHHVPANIPILMGAASRRIIRAAILFTGQAIPFLNGPNLQNKMPITLGGFRIVPYLVDHSAFDAYALLIEADGKKLFYSGDFRAHGRKAKLFNGIVENPPENIDVLLMEGSSLSRLDDKSTFPTEFKIEDLFVEVFRAAAGCVMVHASAQNIDRIVSLYRACKRTNRVMVIDLYAAAILAATGNDQIPQSSWPGVALYVPEAQRKLIKRKNWFDLLDKHQKYNRIFIDHVSRAPSKYVFLFRPLLLSDFSNKKCLNGAVFIYSQWDGYLDKNYYRQMRSWLRYHGIPMVYIHTSGHASPVDLQRFSGALAPKSLIPIHSFFPEKYEKLFDNVVYRNDGEWWNI